MCSPRPRDEPNRNAKIFKKLDVFPAPAGDEPDQGRMRSLRASCSPRPGDEPNVRGETGTAVGVFPAPPRG